MNCPNCDTRANVLDSRHMDSVVIRKHRCPRCKTIFFTREIHMDKTDGYDTLNAFYRSYRKHE